MFQFSSSVTSDGKLLAFLKLSNDHIPLVTRIQCLLSKSRVSFTSQDCGDLLTVYKQLLVNPIIALQHMYHLFILVIALVVIYNVK